MKVRINADGSMEFDVDNVADAAAVIRLATNKVEGIDAEDPVIQVAPRRNAAELNAAQFKVWSYLVDNDSEIGVHIAAVARHVGIKKDNSSWWCQTLVRMGYAKRVSRGYYRALGGGAELGGSE